MLERGRGVITSGMVWIGKKGGGASRFRNVLFVDDTPENRHSLVSSTTTGIYLNSIANSNTRVDRLCVDRVNREVDF